MKITVKASDLLCIVQTAMRGLPNKTVGHPEFGMIRLVADETCLRAMCGNGNFNVETSCDADVIVPGALLCDPKELYTAVALEGDNDVELFLRKTPRDDLGVSGRMRFTGVTKAELRTMSDFAFPRMERQTPSGQVTITPQAIKSLIVSSESSVKGDVYSTNVSVKNGCLTVLNKYSGMGTFVKTDMQDGTEATIPLAYLRIASKAIGVDTYVIEGAHVRCESETACCTFVTTSMPPLYPDQYVDAAPVHKMFIVSSLGPLLNAVLAFSNEDEGNSCEIQYDGGDQVQFCASKSDSQIKTPSVPIRYSGTGELFRETFRGTYLRLAAADFLDSFYMNFHRRTATHFYVAFVKDDVQHVFMPQVLRRTT